MIRKTTLSMLLLAAAASAVIAVSACSGGGGGDDDDDNNTPFPNPYEACLAFWDQYENQTDGSRVGVIGLLDWWTTGSKAIDGNDAFAFILYDGTFGASGQFTATYESTNGSATITAPSNSLAQPVDLSLSGTNWYLASGTGGNATGDNGTMSAFFNDFDDCFGNGDFEDCVLGTGDLSVMIGSTSLSVGASATPQGVALVFCRDLSGFQGTFRERAMHWVRSLPVGSR